jgi:lactoylglutathione lyase
MATIVAKLLHTRMRVDDLEGTLAFYEKVLGLTVLERKESPRGSKLAFLGVPGSEETIEITYYPQSGPVQVQPDLVHLAFQVADMDAFAKHLESLGMAFSDGPETTSSGSVIAFIDAPEGYEIELIQRPA